MPTTDTASAGERMTYARIRTLLTPAQVAEMDADLEGADLLADTDAIDMLLKWACAAEDNAHAVLAERVGRVVAFLEDRAVMSGLDAEDITGVHTDPDGPRRSLTVSDLTAMTVALGGPRPVPMTRTAMPRDRALYAVDGDYLYLVEPGEEDGYLVYDLGTGTVSKVLPDPIGRARTKAVAVALIRADARAQRP